MSNHITAHRKGFPAGLTHVTRHDDPAEASGLGFSVLIQAAGQSHVEKAPCETAYLLMSGRIEVSAGGQTVTMERSSVFDDGPACAHLPAGEAITLRALSPSEVHIYRCANTRTFPVRIFAPNDTPDEHRGKGQVGDASLRLVRTVFDHGNSHPDAELVVGEVVTLPGRWSSYPPHHHPQPELYHYRFDRPQGYGHAELGDDVLKVQQYDTVRILAGNDHAQCAAPGYAMYYTWVIRHLPGKPYTVPEFTAEHRWTMDKAARPWWPKGLDHG